ncbi:hypothetical protein QTN25_007017 [Entamoeba marina]
MIQIGESIINSTKYIHMFEPKHFRLIIETFIGQCDTAPSKLKPRAQILLFKFIPKVFDAIADDFDHVISKTTQNTKKNISIDQKDIPSLVRQGLFVFKLVCSLSKNESSSLLKQTKFHIPLQFIHSIIQSHFKLFFNAQEYFDLIGIEVIPVIKYYLDSNTKEEYLFDLVSNLFTNFYRSPEIQTLFNYLLITLQNETNFWFVIKYHIVFICIS